MFWLVVDLPLWKIWKSVGMIIPNWMESHKVMFQTTNQYWIMLSWSLYIAPNREYVRIQYGIAVMAGLTTLRHVYGHFKVRPIGTP